MTESAPTPLIPDWRTRCDWCGWPLDPAERMCRVDDCSMRPRPAMTPVGEEIFKLKREVRAAEAEAAQLSSLRELDAVARMKLSDELRLVYEALTALRAGAGTRFQCRPDGQYAIDHSAEGNRPLPFEGGEQPK